ncbi:hypothetical protein [Burkholderia sp. LA-2-3-30-S1-D2]|uniref:hypothetical protein n=1 Tax=Burkholderia sp. LA-2-3-30-S1-D2 TaxID=1637862 RepID=UPI0007563C6E|nr:hypothetical protein [Burkholderia sp. LA-2-3-30-S1-D2]AOI98360.1 hypothetical protein WS66_22275 [Burkholderia sp. LA-2-3-30-S1-D2]KVE12563.1 hypothetical protein WS66_16290 [Burkholderia sp. LA-2-3-30-S1-D2]
MADRLVPAQHRLFIARADWRDAEQYPKRPSAIYPSGLWNSSGAITITHKTTFSTVTDMPEFSTFKWDSFVG